MNPNIILPNLIIPGFPKSGTSSLHDYLSQHPQIASGIGKEPHFYSKDQKYENRFNQDSELNFITFYPNKRSAKYFLDSSTSYMISDHALNRIKIDAPNSKIIVIARDPIQQIVSHYKWLGSLGVPLKSFREEILSDANEKWNPLNSFNGCYKYYIPYASYGSQLKKLYSVFPAENIYFVKYEVFFKDVEQEIKKILSFLELNAEYKFDFTPVNITHSKIRLPKFIKKLGRNLPTSLKGISKKVIEKLNLFKTPVAEVKEEDLFFLKDLMKSEINILSELGIDLSHWEHSQKIFDSK